MLAVALAIAAVALAACGGDDAGEARAGDLAAAADPNADDFPRPAPGQALARFAAGIDADRGRLATATTVYTTGHSRVAFAVLADGAPVYGPTVLYASPTGVSPPEVAGPIPAPADRLVGVRRPRAIYDAAAVDMHHRGAYRLLALTEADGRLVAARASVEVVPRRRDPLPGAGERLPDHPDLPDAVGRRPALLVIDPPARCAAAICVPAGPAAGRLDARYGDRVEISRVRADMRLRRALGLTAAPWAIAVDSDGRVAARMEGAIGVASLERAVQAAIARSPDG